MFERSIESPFYAIMKVCTTFIWADNERAIIAMEGPDSFYVPHHQLPMLNSICVYAAQT